MRVKVRGAALVALVLIAGAPPAAGETTKLRHQPAIYVDSKGSPLDRPQGVACAPGRLVVADTGGGRLVLYSVSPQAIKAEAEIALPQIPHPLRVAIDPKGTILALDGKSRKIARISPTGEFLGYLDLAGRAPGETIVAKSLRIDGEGRLYVLDVRGARVLVVAADGTLARQIAAPETSGAVSDLAVAPNGTVFLVASVSKQLFSAGKEAEAATPLGGRLGDDLGFPGALAADGRGRLFLADVNSGGIVVLGQDGSFRGRQSGHGWREGLLRHPSDLCIDEAGTLYVADRENNRVQVFTTGP
jgi:sugar lactone lactonase YvrE